MIRMDWRNGMEEGMKSKIVYLVIISDDKSFRWNEKFIPFPRFSFHVRDCRMDVCGNLVILSHHPPPSII